MANFFHHRKFILILIPLVFVLLYFTLQWRAKIVVENFLDNKIPSHFVINYQSLKVDFLQGDILFIRPDIKILNHNGGSAEILIDINQISIKDISYWKLLYHREIKVQNVVFDEPKVLVHQKERKSQVENKTIKLLKPILIEHLELKDGSVKIIKDKEKEIFRLDSLNIIVGAAKTNATIINKKIPFEHETLDVGFKNFFATAGKYETIEVAEFHLAKNILTINRTHFHTELSKRELNRIIPYERDHVNLEIDKTIIEKMDLGVNNDSLSFSAKSGAFSGFELDIFRDKNPPDDLKHKSLYGKILKSLPFKLSMETLAIEESRVSYKEEEQGRENSGELRFENVSGQIKNLSNLSDEEQKTKMSFSSELMGKGSLTLEWSFNVNDPQQRFIARGSLSDFDTANLDDFLRPNLRVRTEGEIEQLFFTISGDKYVANGDVKMRYHNFKFNVLNKDRLHINKVLTFIGNLFIDDGSKADENGFRYGKIENVKRNQDKSFFNYLWISLQEGLLHLLSGSGKKK